MIVDLKTISKETKSFKFIFEKSFFRDYMEDERVLGIDKPIVADVSLSRVDDRFLIEGHISGRLEMKCDRCLCTYYHTLDSDFKSYLTTNPPDKDLNEIELSEEDMDLDFVPGDEIRLDEIVRGFIFLTLPMKSICRPDCLGLCAVCGTNLNVERCECRGNPVNPAFAKLRHFKPKGE
jgi:uncharacterized protein